MKAYVIVMEAQTARGLCATVSEIGHPHIETARIELVEKIDNIKKDPIPYFGYARTKDLKTTWTTDRMCNIKDTFGGGTIDVYIHEIEIPNVVLQTKEGE